MYDVCMGGTLVGTTAALSENIKGLIERNAAELSTIEGNMLSVAQNRRVKTLLFTSCNHGEGKTIAAVSMSYALSKLTNSKILLIDGNLHKPALHDLFNISRAPGFSDLLIKGADYESVLRPAEFKNLSIMPCGAETANPLDVYKAATFKEKLDHYKEQYDFVIVDGHSMSSSSGAAVTARHFDGVVMVIECEKTRWEVFATAREKIEKVGGTLLGTVLNKRKYYIPQFLYGKI
jgi:capsular exopolysaccharide synthesis family protein